MKPHRTWTLLGLAVAASLWLTSVAHADDPKLAPPQKDTLQAVLDRIKVHAAGEAWKQPGFKDEAIEAWLDKLLGAIAKAADIRDLTLPVRLKDVGNVPPVRPGLLEGALVVGKDVDLSNTVLRKSVILADGSVRVGAAMDSVVVARNMITVDTNSNNSVLVAGVAVVSSRDGDLRGAGSVVISRGWADLTGRATGTIVAAHEGIYTRDTTNVIYLNAPVPQPAAGPRGRGGFGVFGAPRDTGSISVRVPDLPLEALPAHPLADKLKLLGVLHSVVKAQPGILRASSVTGAMPTAVLLQYEGRRYIADLNQPITDEARAAVPVLSELRLLAITNQYTLFSKPDADIVLRLEGK